MLGFSILSASIGSSVVQDRVTGAKRLQHVSGLGYRTYWLTHFLAQPALSPVLPWDWNYPGKDRRQSWLGQEGRRMGRVCVCVCPEYQELLTVTF